MGSGFFGTDAKIVFEAPFTGSYFVVAQDYHGYAPGGYVLNLASASSTEPLTTTTWETYSEYKDGEAYFGSEQLASAFSDLPPSFQQADSLEVESFMGQAGLGGAFTDLIVYLSEYPNEMIMVASAVLADNEIGLFDLWMANQDLDDFTREFLYWVAYSTQSVEIHETQLLDTGRIGDLVVGATIDATMDGFDMSMDAIAFRRGYLVGYVWTYVPVGETPAVSAEEVALMLDAKMQKFVYAR